MGLLILGLVRVRLLSAAYDVVEMCDWKLQCNDEEIHGSEKQSACSAEPCSEEVKDVSVEACA